MHYRTSALLAGLLFALYGSAEAQQSTGPYIQVSPTPSKLSVGGPGFVQVDANGIASVVAQAPGSGTVTNTSGALAANSMVIGNGGADIKTVGGSIGGAFTTAGNVSLTGASLGLTLAFPSNGPFTYTFPLATSTLASLAGSETFTNKIYSGGQLSGTFSGNPTYTGVPLFTNLSAGTQVACLGLDASFHLVTLNASCGAGGGGGGISTVTDGTRSQTSATTLSLGRCLVTTNGSSGTAPVNVAGRTAHGDSNYTVLSTDCYVVTSATQTAARTYTLPAASAFSAGAQIQIYDEFGGVTPTNSLAIAPNGTDTINGVNNATTSTIAVAYGGYTLKTDGSAKWTATANTIQQAYNCTGTKYASAQNAQGVTTCTGLPSTGIPGGWIATIDPNNIIIGHVDRASTVTSIVGTPEVLTGAAATITVKKAPNGTTCSAGTALHSGTFNANSGAATNQTLTLVGGAPDVLAPLDRICFQTTGTWSGPGVGTITVFVSPN